MNVHSYTQSCKFFLLEEALLVFWGTKVGHRMVHKDHNSHKEIVTQYYDVIYDEKKKYYPDVIGLLFQEDS